jgi:hypothetical protein
MESLGVLQRSTAAIPPTAAPVKPIPVTAANISQLPTVPVPPVALAPASQAAPVSTAAVEVPGETYDDGILLAKSDTIPFRLELWDVTQVRFLNTANSNKTFTDHLGVEHPVTRRNDITLNRNLFQFTGFVWDERLRYNLITWASNSSASIVIGGYVSWRFHKALTAYGGYWGSPGSRTLTGTFPYFIGYDRSMADNFFRPSFTQGVWVDGQPVKGLYYNVFLGDGLNTLGVPLSKVSTAMVTSGSVWWEPFGDFGPPGRARSMYDDYEQHQSPVIRVGTGFTRSRENRFANTSQPNPENAALFNSDGVNTFATGAFAPGVTVSDTLYRMWAMDGGLKWRGFAANGQYFFRWLGEFEADGPLPLTSTYDHGGEAVLSYFVKPKKLELYARTSFVFGHFRNSNEWSGGFKYYPVNTYKVWLIGEAVRVNRVPLQSTIGGYNAGMSGWMPVAQLMFNF